MKAILAVLLFSSFHTYAQHEAKSIVGSYYSVNNRFERSAEIHLKADSTFQYLFGVGGCQYNMTGSWTIQGRYLHLKNDAELGNTGKEVVNTITTAANEKVLMVIPQAFYPDLSLVAWKFRRNTVRPIVPLDLGCFTEVGRYEKLPAQK